MKFYYSHRGQTHSIEVQAQGDRLRATVDGETVEALVRQGQSLQLTLAGQPMDIAWAKDGRTIWLHVAGHSYQLERVAGGRAGSTAGSAERSLRAPMPGQVRKVLVEPGQPVAAGSVLVLLEAMKMEVRISAGQDAKVAHIAVSEGQSVDKDQLLVELEPTDGG
ncbi:MAG TPA: biotin/lipoyl-binding protein [Anaerolineales bacterium]|nr:biotin/lipoyl-binding protein [Anaerolineales bacterium]HRQ92554.1 biotin/lipoyl-binding protein [Anaerolineales bacterium]